MFGRRTTTTTRRPRPRAVWAALVTSVVICVLIVVGVLLPVLTLIGAADGGTAGALDVPVGSIAAAIAIGCVPALVLLLLVVKVRNGALAWVLGGAAVISTLVVSLWPLVAVALAGVDQVQDLIPFIQDLIARFWPGN
ncbi:hypothetical protein [Frigoribacterium sp. RIT-PI-h]|uniref:hypothetical protein n=1 Tax=Frigoribacterium sp. RIT-PI-h TaxID=1690245 RepID=UPI0006B8E900|nr:hypothetical protein [Frigoribacterium sp. RIT-PI-h]KPG88933.1 hypothetical protein AEQ27_00205 [Frigoribacterium sp. RIT-PI-h]